MKPWEEGPGQELLYAHELPIALVRVDGAWNGYVGCLFGENDGDKGWPWPGEDLVVHGGVTWVGELPRTVKVADGDHWGEPIAGRRWIGFDCCHAGDFVPLLEKELERLADLAAGHPIYKLPVYRDLAYVRREAIELARQLAERGAR